MSVGAILFWAVSVAAIGGGSVAVVFCIRQRMYAFAALLFVAVINACIPTAIIATMNGWW